MESPGRGLGETCAGEFGREGNSGNEAQRGELRQGSKGFILPKSRGNGSSRGVGKGREEMSEKELVLGQSGNWLPWLRELPGPRP